MEERKERRARIRQARASGRAKARRTLSVNAAAAFVTHTAKEVAILTDDQVLIMWSGAHDWRNQALADLANARLQLKATEAEITRRGIKKKPIGEII
jgi:hypothetical protein